MFVFQSGHCSIRRSIGYKVVIGPWLFFIMINDLFILGHFTIYYVENEIIRGSGVEL